MFYEEMEAGLPAVGNFTSRNFSVSVNGEAVPLIAGNADVSPDNKGNISAVSFWRAAF